MHKSAVNAVNSNGACDKGGARGEAPPSRVESRARQMWEINEKTLFQLVGAIFYSILRARSAITHAIYALDLQADLYSTTAYLKQFSSTVP